MSDTRTDFLLRLANELPENPICIELGVLHGDFSDKILKILQPKKLFLVDPYITGLDKNSNRMYGQGGESELATAYSTDLDLMQLRTRFSHEILIGQAIIRKKFSYDAVKDFVNDYFDFIYIDACHLYESVKADLNDYLPKLKKDGLMCLHDYAHINDFGVIQATDEFINEFGFKIIELKDTNIALKRK